MTNKKFGNIISTYKLGPNSVGDRIKDPLTSMKFIELQDTFISYSGDAGKFLQIKSDLTGVEVSAIAITSDIHFAYSQITEAAEWTIAHNLNKYPDIIIIKDKNIIEGEIQYTDQNNLVVRFEIAINGIVYCN